MKPVSTSALGWGGGAKALFTGFGWRERLMIGSAALACSGTFALSLTTVPAFAVTQGPQWTVTSVAVPTNFKPGENAYRVTVTNTGGASSNGEPVTITDELPAGFSLAAAAASGVDQLVAVSTSNPGGANFSCVLRSCTYAGVVVPDDTLIITFPVNVEASAPPSVTNIVRVAGGGAVSTSMSTPTNISATDDASFGISQGGATTALSSTQAGAHPDITTSIAFNTVNRKGSLAGDPKELITEEPPGFAGDLVDTPTCAPAMFSQDACPISTQVGVTTLTVLQLTESLPKLQTEPVYNLSPNPGEVAKFGFDVIGNFRIQGNVSVRPGDYGLRVTFDNADETPAELDSVSLTVWGVPADPIHDTWRFEHSGTGPRLAEGGVHSEVAPTAYFTNPTSCENKQLEAVFRATSWEHPNEGESPPPTKMLFGPIVGCDRLSLPTTFTAEPTTNSADAPTGLNVNLDVAQTYDNAYGLATSTLKKAIVTLPEGMTVNPSAGAGLGACTQAEYEEEELEVSLTRGCPNDSKLGTVTIETPALKERATGSVFIAQPYANPFGSLIGLYVVARFPQRGVLVKVAGKTTADETTGRLVTTFEGTPTLSGPSLEGLPPVPFSSFTFQFHQGPTSPLVSPPVCGSYRVSAVLTPWSEPENVLTQLAPAFSITQGFEEGSPCPSGGVPPFAPGVSAGTLDNEGGSYSPLDLRITRKDGEQEITRFSSQLPPGLTANLSGIPFCSDTAIEQAKTKSGGQEQAEPSCPEASSIGHTLVGAGVGSVLAWAPGKLYMAGPYHGAPFSVVAITSAKVGPFDLGTVVVREALKIDPTTAVVTVDASASDPIPHIIKGIVVHVRDIRVYVDRSSFTLNPTSCAHMSFAATIGGAGADPSNPADEMPVTVTDPFQAADCQALKFKPMFKVSTSGKTSRRRGASLTVKLTYPNAPQGSQANIRSVKVDLPRQLPSRLTTLQKACPDSTFNANPATCPQASKVGSATAVTPILPVPLAGPAYFVSHGGAKFPELVIVLQGYGVTIYLHGETFISKAGITSSTFRTVPDQPVRSFDLTLPQGPYSALAANGNLCKAKLAMPTIFTAQNGLVIHQSTKITVMGCPKSKRVVRKQRRQKGAHASRKKK